MQWYYILDGQQSGPVDEDEIRRLMAEGRLQSSSLVWNETMGSEWRSVADVPGLAEGAAPADVPAPQVAEAPSLLKAETTSRFTEPAHVGEISCTAPIGLAWARMKEILFGPFDFKKWLLLGFTAFLANAQQGGSFNYRSGGGDFENMPDMSQLMEKGQSFLQEHAAEMMIIISIGVVVLLVAIAFGLLLTWVTSRGRFMFLDNVVHNCAEVKRPWAVFVHHGNSLFFWRVVFGLVCFVLFLLLGGLATLTVILPKIQAPPGTALPWAGIVVCGLIGLVLMLVISMTMFFLDQFVIPLMYICDLTAREAWSRFLALLRANLGKFVLYTLMYMLLSMVGGLAAMILLIPLCCFLWCFFLIPFFSSYLLAVAFLPITVFFRQYSLDYLAQYGAEYRT